MTATLTDTSTGTVHTVHMVTPTLGTREAMVQWRDRLTAQTATHDAATVRDTVQALMRINDDLGHYIDERANLNAATIASYMQREVVSHRSAYDAYEAQERAAGNEPAPYAPLADADVLKAATERLRNDWQLWCIDNPAIARRLLFTMDAYPTTYAALLVGIDCIRATVDVERTDAATVVLIQSANESPFWQGVSAREVADYCDRFRRLHQ